MDSAQGNTRQGQSYLWALVIFLSLVLAAVLAGYVGLHRLWASILLVFAGIFPLMLQLAIGYALDNRWRARWRREEQPARYWAMIALSFALAAWFGYAAYALYLEGG